MGKRSKDTITLGSGKIYLMEFKAGEPIPENSKIETESNLLAYIQGGAELSYESEYHEASDDLGYVKKSKITKESASLKLGLVTWTGNTIEKLAPTARVSEAEGIRTTKVGGAGNDNGKKYLARFLHEDKADGNVRITLVGKNKSGFTLKFDKENETVVDMEFGAEPGLDKDGTLIILDEDIDKPGVGK